LDPKVCLGALSSMIAVEPAYQNEYKLHLLDQRIKELGIVIKRSWHE
jgi:hypothetical protein